MVFSLTLAIMSVTSDKITSGTIVMINTLQKLIYSHCQIIFMFYDQRDRYKHIGSLSQCLAIKNVLRMQGGHKPFSYVTVSFSPLHHLTYSQFCLIWTLLLYTGIWKTDTFAWLFIYVSLNLVTFVFDLKGQLVQTNRMFHYRVLALTSLCGTCYSLLRPVSTGRSSGYGDVIKVKGLF